MKNITTTEPRAPSAWATAKRRLAHGVLGLGALFLAHNAQAQKWLWAHQEGGTSNEHAQSVGTEEKHGFVAAVGSFSGSASFGHKGTVKLTGRGKREGYLLIMERDGSIVSTVSIGGSGEEEILDVAFDDSANVYVAGYYGADSAQIITGSSGKSLTRSFGSTDGFVAKFSLKGALQWVRTFNGKLEDRATDLAVRDGRVFVTGTFSQLIYTDNAKSPIYATGKQDVFVARLSANSGALQDWTSFGGPGDDFSGDIGIGARNEPYLLGSFADTLTSLSVGTLKSIAGRDIFLLKLAHDNIQKCIWAAHGGTSGNDWGNGLSLDKNSNVYITGSLQGNASFATKGKTTGGIKLTTTSGGNDIFLLKYDSSGKAQWGHIVGGAKDDAGMAVSATQAGAVYLTGYFSSNDIEFDSAIYLESYHHGGGYKNAFAAMYGATGKAEWAKRIAANDISEGNGVAICESFQRLYYTGTYDDSLVLEDTAGAKMQFLARGDFDALVGALQPKPGHTTPPPPPAKPKVLHGKVTTSTGIALKKQPVYLLYFNAADTSLYVRDTFYTDTLGRYEFHPTDSLVYVLAAPDSAIYPNEMPTYYDSALVFQDGKLIAMNAQSVVANFNTLYGANPGGPGLIAGKLVMCMLCKQGNNGKPVVGEKVVLMDKDGKPLAFTYTDSYGAFTFANLPIGTYKVWIDKAYVDNAKAPSLTLTSSIEKQTKLEFILYPTYLQLDQTTGVDAEDIAANTLGVQPNPFTNELNLKLNFAERTQLSIVLLDMQGRTLQILFTGGMQAGTSILPLQTTDLMPGMYLLKAQCGQTTQYLRVMKAE